MTAVRRVKAFIEANVVPWNSRLRHPIHLADGHVLRTLIDKIALLRGFARASLACGRDTKPTQCVLMIQT
jgi:hypothetical protein